MFLSRFTCEPKARGTWGEKVAAIIKTTPLRFFHAGTDHADPGRWGVEPLPAKRLNTSEDSLSNARNGRRDRGRTRRGVKKTAPLGRGRGRNKARAGRGGGQGELRGARVKSRGPSLTRGDAEEDIQGSQEAVLRPA